MCVVSLSSCPPASSRSSLSAPCHRPSGHSRILSASAAVMVMDGMLGISGRSMLGPGRPQSRPIGGPQLVMPARPAPSPVVKRSTPKRRVPSRNRARTSLPRSSLLVEEGELTAWDRLRGLDDDELRPWEVQQVETIEANARVWNLLQEARERKSYSTSQSVQEWVKAIESDAESAVRGVVSRRDQFDTENSPYNGDARALLRRCFAIDEQSSGIKRDSKYNELLRHDGVYDCRRRSRPKASVHRYTSGTISDESDTGNGVDGDEKDVDAAVDDSITPCQRRIKCEPQETVENTDQTWTATQPALVVHSSAEGSDTTNQINVRRPDNGGSATISPLHGCLERVDSTLPSVDAGDPRALPESSPGADVATKDETAEIVPDPGTVYDNDSGKFGQAGGRGDSDNADAANPGIESPSPCIPGAVGHDGVAIETTIETFDRDPCQAQDEPAEMDVAFYERQLAVRKQRRAFRAWSQWANAVLRRRFTASITAFERAQHRRLIDTFHQWRAFVRSEKVARSVLQESEERRRMAGSLIGALAAMPTTENGNTTRPSPGLRQSRSTTAVKAKRVPKKFDLQRVGHDTRTDMYVVRRPSTPAPDVVAEQRRRHAEERVEQQRQKAMVEEQARIAAAAQQRQREEELKAIADLAAEQERQRRRQIASQMTALALMHRDRSSIVYRGWGPWRRLVEFCRQQQRSSVTFYNAKLISRTWRSWHHARSVRATVLVRAEEVADHARIRTAWGQWRSALQQGRSSRHLMRMRVAVRFWHKRVQRRLRVTSKRGQRVRLRRLWMRWRAAATRAETDRFKQAMWDKVHAWLAEPP